jgi:hypothetical protein
MLWSQETSLSRLSSVIFHAKVSQANSVMTSEGCNQHHLIHYSKWKLSSKALYQFVPGFLLQNAPATTNSRKLLSVRVE